MAGFGGGLCALECLEMCQLVMYMASFVRIHARYIIQIKVAAWTHEILITLCLIHLQVQTPPFATDCYLVHSHYKSGGCCVHRWVGWVSVFLLPTDKSLIQIIFPPKIL